MLPGVGNVVGGRTNAHFMGGGLKSQDQTCLGNMLQKE